MGQTLSPSVHYKLKVKRVKVQNNELLYMWKLPLQNKNGGWVGENYMCSTLFRHQMLSENEKAASHEAWVFATWEKGTLWLAELRATRGSAAAETRQVKMSAVLLLGPHPMTMN